MFCFLVWYSRRFSLCFPGCDQSGGVSGPVKESGHFATRYTDSRWWLPVPQSLWSRRLCWGWYHGKLIWAWIISLLVTCWLSLLRRWFYTWCRPVRWSCGHQVRQMGIPVSSHTKTTWSQTSTWKTMICTSC